MGRRRVSYWCVLLVLTSLHHGSNADPVLTVRFMKLIMMGTGPFAVPIFQALLASPHTVAHVMTRPDRNRGGRQAASNPMRSAAEFAGVPIAAPESINSDEAQQLLRAISADLFVVCDYGQILSRDTLGLAPHGGVNLHASLLPKYRGAAPINWAIYHGETETGVTVIHMTPHLDAGPCLVQRRVDIESQETADALEPRLAQLGIEPVLAAIEMIGQHDGMSQLGTLQDQTLASKAPRLHKNDGKVCWERSALQIADQVRAMKPWPRTFTELHREAHPPLRLILAEMSVSNIERGPNLPGRRVTSDDATRLDVATGSGVLSLNVIQPAGKRAMSSEEFLRGHPIGAEDRLGGEVSHNA